MNNDIVISKQISPDCNKVSIINQLRLIHLVPRLPFDICLHEIEVLWQQLITQVPNCSFVGEISQRIKVHTTVRLTPAGALGPGPCLTFQGCIGGT